MVEKILLEAAVDRSSPTADDIQSVYRDLASVCSLWQKILDGTEFQRLFLERLFLQCKSIDEVPQKAKSFA